jgi:tetratricopeptide (TPR) repeat protein
MKKKLVKKYTNLSILMAVFLLLNTACSPRAEKLYEQASRETEKGHFRIAVDLLEKSFAIEKDNVLRNKYLFEAARLVRFEIQDYPRAVKLFKKIILESEDEVQRIQAQESICEIYLENLQDYSSALKELQLLEPLLKDTKKKERARLKIAQTLYLTGNYQQALEEIEAAQKYIQYHEVHYLKLKAEVLVAQKKYKDSIAAYENLKLKYPDYFSNENLFIAASIVYEENEQYADALKYLIANESLIKDKAYYELRVKRLKERMTNKPLFKGIRK